MLLMLQMKEHHIVKTYSKNEIGPCFSTIYDPKLKRLYYGFNYKSKSPMAKAEYERWRDKEAHDCDRTEKGRKLIWHPAAPMAERHCGMLKSLGVRIIKKYVWDYSDADMQHP